MLEGARFFFLKLRQMWWEFYKHACIRICALPKRNPLSIYLKEVVSRNETSMSNFQNNFPLGLGVLVSIHRILAKQRTQKYDRAILPKWFFDDRRHDDKHSGFKKEICWPVQQLKLHTGLSKKMNGIWNRYDLKSTERIYTFCVLKCSEKFKVLDLP